MLIETNLLRFNTFSPQICVNDDLVAKKFAYYSRKSAESSRLDEEDRSPLMLSPGIFTQTAAQIQPAPGEHTDTPCPRFFGQQDVVHLHI